jgi:hypothetical protein
MPIDNTKPGGPRGIGRPGFVRGGFDDTRTCRSPINALVAEDTSTRRRVRGLAEVGQFDPRVQRVLHCFGQIGEPVHVLGRYLDVPLIVFGVLMIRGAMPTWLGVVWIVCGVLFWATGFLPLWFFVGSLTLGIWGLLNFRPESGTGEQVAAIRAD